MSAEIGFAMSNPVPQLFLSYSSSDEKLASALKKHLEARISGLTVFMADKSIKQGEDWERCVHASLKESFAFVPIITANWQKSNWCFAEWVAASVLGQIILPFVETKTKLRPELRKLQHRPFDKKRPDFKALTTDVDCIFTQNRAKKDLTKPPIPWAFRYEQKDADLFRGRDMEIDSIVSQLNAMRHSYDNGPLFLHGPSSSGKSSLARAGIYPKLRSTPDLWVVAHLFQTTANPFDDLVESLSRSINNATLDKGDVATTIKEIKDVTQEKLAEAIKHLSELLAPRTIILLIDNLDRYLDDSTPQFERFLELLRSAIRVRSVYMIGLLRSDQLQRVAVALNTTSSEYHTNDIAPPDPTILIPLLNELLKEKGYDYVRCSYQRSTPLRAAPEKRGL
jgi:hypothetical protein